MQYDMTQPKKTLACVLQSSSDRSDLSEPKYFGRLDQRVQGKKLTLHDDIPTVGVCPATLGGKSGYIFAPTNDDVTKLIEDAKQLGQGKFLWAFKYSATDSSFSPYGIVLCTGKQVIVQAKGKTQFT